MEHSRVAAFVALAILVATPLSAGNGIVELGAQEPAMRLDVGMVNADADGILAIFAYRTGEVGEKLGEVPVFAGANADVPVLLTRKPLGDVLAVLYDAAGNPLVETVIAIK